jgi:DNA-directed RNA polymerase alpha subunit
MQYESMQKTLQDTREALQRLQRQVEQQQQQIERLLEHFEESQAPKREKIPVEDLPTTPRLENCLMNAGFEYFEDVFSFYQEKGDVGLLRLKNFGRKSLNEVKDLFKEYGFLEDRNNVRW